MSNDRLKFRVWDNVNYMSGSFTLDDLQSRKIQFTSDCVVMQWTGLYDSEGEMIWEGDIVRVYAEFGMKGKHPKSVGPKLPVVGEVKFIAPEFFYKEPDWQQMERTGKGNATDWYRGVPALSDSTVIGNIYENPELLERPNG